MYPYSKKYTIKQLTISLCFMATLVVQGQDSASVQVIARSSPDKVMLRWAVDRPLEWTKANEYGVLVERSTISRNGEAVVLIEKMLLVPDPLKSKPIQEWAMLTIKVHITAIWSPNLFGERFGVI